MSFAEARIKEWRSLPPESRFEVFALPSSSQAEFHIWAVVKIGSHNSTYYSPKDGASQSVGLSEDEVESILSKQAVISLPTTRRASNRPAPVNITGKPISETIIEERR